MTDLEKYIIDCIERNEDYQADYSGCVEAEYGNIYISCLFSIKRESYCSAAYFNGTGAFVETYYYFYIDDITVYDENDNEIIVDIEAIEDYINKEH